MQNRAGFDDDWCGLAGHQGNVCFGLAVFQHAVDRRALAACQHDTIPRHQLTRRDGFEVAVILETPRQCRLQSNEMLGRAARAFAQ